MFELRTTRLFLACLPLLILAACLQVSDGGQLSMQDTPPGVTETPTIVGFPATETPTNTPLPATMTPTPEQKTNLGRIIVADDFTRPGLWLLGRFNDGSIAFGLNEMTLAVSAPKGILTSFRQEPTLPNFYIEVTASPNLCVAQDAYGLVVRAGNVSDFYAFLLSCDGQVRAERDKISERIPLKDWKPASGKVTPDIGGSTRLGVWAYGNEMRFFVNGVYQFTVLDPAFPRGLVGLHAHASGASVLTVNFSDLQVWEISGIPVLQATLTPRGSE
ncbi:MAG: hypothetical protein JW704_07670 [Anaerolineaceae bacterium]|nr:hypothetical protein [Anaerolineaceae bacterium]